MVTHSWSQKTRRWPKCLWYNNLYLSTHKALIGYRHVVDTHISKRKFFKFVLKLITFRTENPSGVHSKILMNITNILGTRNIIAGGDDVANQSQMPSNEQNDSTHPSPSSQNETPPIKRCSSRSGYRRKSANQCQKNGCKLHIAKKIICQDWTSQGGYYGSLFHSIPLL